MKSGVQSITNFDFKVENNEKDPKFKVGNHVRISKFEKNVAKACKPYWSEEIFVITKDKKILHHQHM